jgi:hypothetical protein
MTRGPAPRPQTGPGTWTIARILNNLSGPTLERRFLTDLIHAPADQLTHVFTAWRDVAASIEAHSNQPRG